MAIIEHTDVDESLKGQGIGKRLVAKVVEKCAGRSGRLSRYVRLRNTSSIKRASMMIFVAEQRNCIRRKQYKSEMRLWAYLSGITP